MMKWCILAAVLVAGSVAVGQTKKETKAPPKASVVGAWERVGLPAALRQVKMYSDTRFAWAAFQGADGQVAAVGGGTYTFDGKTLKETYEYGAGSVIAQFVKKEPATFTITFEKDGWVQEGKTPLGAEIRESYRRAR